LRSAWLLLDEADVRSVNHSQIDVGILFVEDQPSCRTATVMLLQHLGYSLDAVATGEEALTCFDPDRHKIVITDLLMPGMSGEDLAIEIKRRAPSTPIVVYTGTGVVELQGVDAVIAKPASIDDFRKTLAELLSPCSSSVAEQGELSKRPQYPDHEDVAAPPQPKSQHRSHNSYRSSSRRCRTD
jgi:CheY-like chemotaxis protein